MATVLLAAIFELIKLSLLNLTYIDCVNKAVITGTFNKNENIMNKSKYFVSLISESETHILYRFITHRVKYLKPLFLEILMIQIMKTQNSMSQFFFYIT